MGNCTNGEKWSVYKHTFPNGKVYIGITSQDPYARWDNGMGYIKNKRMFYDIVQFGWNNISHEILKSGLSEKAARAMERDIILSFGKDGRIKTYNTAHTVFEHDIKDEILRSVYKKAVKRDSFKNLVGNDWVETYSPSGMYISLTYDLECVTLYAFGKDVFAVMYRFDIPEELITVVDVMNWLYSSPTPSATEAIPFDYHSVSCSLAEMM